MGRRTALTLAATVLAMTAAACGTVTGQGSRGHGAPATARPGHLPGDHGRHVGRGRTRRPGRPARQLLAALRAPGDVGGVATGHPAGRGQQRRPRAGRGGRAVGYRGFSAQPGPEVLAAGQQRRQRHQLAARRAGRRSGRRPGRPGRGPRQRPSARPARQRENRAGRTGRGGMVAADQRARAGRDPGGPPVRPGHRGRGRLLAVRRPAARRDLLAPGRGRHLLLRRRDLAPSRAGTALRPRPAGRCRCCG